MEGKSKLETEIPILAATRLRCQGILTELEMLKYRVERGNHHLRGSSYVTGRAHNHMDQKVQSDDDYEDSQASNPVFASTNEDPATDEYEGEDPIIEQLRRATAEPLPMRDINDELVWQSSYCTL